MRRNAKVDANQSDIVKAIRKTGETAKPTHMVGSGFPDVVASGRCECGRKTNFLLEIKDGTKPPSARKLTDDEADFHATWEGQVAVVKDIDEALAALGIKHKGQIS